MAVTIFVLVLVLVLVALVVVAYLLKQRPELLVVEGHEIKKRTWVKGGWSDSAPVVAYSECECGWNGKHEKPDVVDHWIKMHLRESKERIDEAERNRRLLEEGKENDFAW